MFNPEFSYITNSDGKVYQVLNASQDGWDEQKTADSIQAGQPAAEIVNGEIVAL